MVCELGLRFNSKLKFSLHQATENVIDSRLIVIVWLQLELFSGSLHIPKVVFSNMFIRTFHVYIKQGDKKCKEKSKEDRCESGSWFDKRLRYDKHVSFYVHKLHRCKHTVCSDRVLYVSEV